MELGMMEHGIMVIFNQEYGIMEPGIMEFGEIKHHGIMELLLKVMMKVLINIQTTLTNGVNKMNKKNIRIAKELVKLAKELTSTLFEDDIYDHNPQVMENVNNMPVDDVIELFCNYVDNLGTVNDCRIKLKNKALEKLRLGQELTALNKQILGLPYNIVYPSLTSDEHSLTNSSDPNSWYRIFDSFQRAGGIKFRAALIRLNHSLQKIEFITQDTSLLDADVREYVQDAINSLTNPIIKKNNNNIKIDQELIVKFNNALIKRGLQAIRRDGKQPADRRIYKYINEKERAGQLNAKITKGLRIAANWTRASMMIISTLDDIQDEKVKVFVSNTSALMQQADKLTRQLQIQNDSQGKPKLFKTAGFLSNLKEKLFGIFNKIANGFNYIKSKIQSFLNRNQIDELEKLTDEFEKVVNS